MDEIKPNMTTPLHIIEVGPRDGLQNSPILLNIDQKKALLTYLIEAGFSDIEAGSFVRPDKIEAMQGSDVIARELSNEADKLWYLAPNQKGLELALNSKARQIAFFTATSESFNTKNIGMSVSQSIASIRESLELLTRSGYTFVTKWDQKPSQDRELKLRLYISTVIGCPYEGDQKPEVTAGIIDELFDLGFAQVSLGDTIGVGTPSSWKKLFKSIEQSMLKENKVAMHCHDTYGTALACVAFGLETGITSFDSSIGGLGGCPYAKGATGNLATEDLIYFLKREGYTKLPDLDLLLQTFQPERTGALLNGSRVSQALNKNKCFI